MVPGCCLLYTGCKGRAGVRQAKGNQGHCIHFSCAFHAGDRNSIACSLLNSCSPSCMVTYLNWQLTPSVCSMTDKIGGWALAMLTASRWASATIAATGASHLTKISLFPTDCTTRTCMVNLTSSTAVSGHRRISGRFVSNIGGACMVLQPLCQGRQSAGHGVACRGQPKYWPCPACMLSAKPDVCHCGGLHDHTWAGMHACNSAKAVRSLLHTNCIRCCLGVCCTHPNFWNGLSWGMRRRYCAPVYQMRELDGSIVLTSAPYQNTRSSQQCQSLLLGQLRSSISAFLLLKQSSAM